MRLLGARHHSLASATRAGQPPSRWGGRIWVLLAAAAGCSLGGSTVIPYAPDVIAANINTATALITSPVFASFAGLGPLIQVPGTSPTPPYFADSLRGRRFVWDTSANAYVLAGQDTAPARGVRFILYTADSATGRPVEPPTQLGTAEFQDGPPDTTALHVRVDGGAPETTVAYLLSGTFHPDSFQATVDGCVSDVNARNLCVAASVRQRLAGGDTAVTLSGTASATGVSFTFQIVFHFSAAGLSDTIDVSALSDIQSQVIRMSGTTQFGTTTKADLALSVNDQPFATVRGTGTLTVRRSNGEAISAEEQALIGAMFSLPGELLDLCRALARPGQQLLS
jgi:hypothetical protein